MKKNIYLALIFLISPVILFIGYQLFKLSANNFHIMTMEPLPEKYCFNTSFERNDGYIQNETCKCLGIKVMIDESAFDGGIYPGCLGLKKETCVITEKSSLNDGGIVAENVACSEFL